MERVTGIGGLFFRAADPDRLATWYATHLGVDRPPESYDTCSWWQQSGPTVFAAMPAASEHFGGPEHTWSVNFRVDDLDAMVRQLRAQPNFRATEIERIGERLIEALRIQHTTWLELATTAPMRLRVEGRRLRRNFHTAWREAFRP